MSSALIASERRAQMGGDTSTGDGAMDSRDLGCYSGNLPPKAQGPPAPTSAPVRPATTFVAMHSPESETAPTTAVAAAAAMKLAPGVRPRADSEHYNYSDAAALPSFPRPRADPASFPDPYPHLPPLSSAGSSSASTRSSAYTNPGSTISGSGFSGDYSHVRVASGDDADGGALTGMGINAGHGTESIVELLSRASNGSSLSSGSRKSHGHAVHVAPMPSVRSRMLRSARAPPPPPAPEDAQPTQPPRLRSQPSYDTSWQREHEDFATSEDDDYDYGDQQDGEEEYDDAERDPEPGSAIVVAEEGRALIVRGEGQPVSSLPIQAGMYFYLNTKTTTKTRLLPFILFITRNSSCASKG